MSKCYNICRKYVDLGSLEPDVHSKTSNKGDAVNTLKKLVAILAILAFSLIGVGADLPFGEVAWKNHVATNGYTTLVSVFQSDPESGDIVDFYADQKSTKFNSHVDFLAYIQQELNFAEDFLIEGSGFNPNIPLGLYIATAVWPASSPPHYGVNDFIYVGDMIAVDGHWEFPDGFLESVALEYDRWQVLPLRKKVVSAKLSYTNRVTGRVDEQDTATASGFPERLVKVNSRGSVMIHEDFVWGNPDYDLRLTVRYTDGKTDTWDENGRTVGIAPVPAKLTLISDASGEIKLHLTGTIGQRVTVQQLTDRWEDLRTVVFTNTTIRIPYDPSTNTVGLFRLTE